VTATGPVPSVKEPHLAGRWYPADAKELADVTRAMLAAGGPPRAGVVAVIVPHAAYEYSGPTAARGLAAAGPGFGRVVVVAPSHFARFRGAAVLPMQGYRTPLGVMTIDRDAIGALGASPLVRANPAVFLREHALEIELPLLQALAPRATLVPILVGALDPGDAAALADALRPLLVPGTLLVISSDLTHYGRRFDFLPVPPTDAASVAGAMLRIDDGALTPIVSRDPEGFRRYVEETGATICGRDPIELLLRTLPPGARGERVAYATSLDTTGEYDHAVSYAAVAFTSS
jgi:MEMO1 family protein